MKLHGWLACVGLVSVLSGCNSDDSQKVAPANRSERGEACEARNDCVDGLACIGGLCLLNEYPIAVQTKECFRIECQIDEDCCQNFSPSVTQATCDLYSTECTTNLDQYYCDLYNQNCICNEICEDELCISAINCSDTIPCAEGVCDNGVCVECVVDIDCPGDGTCNVETNRCIDHCTVNEECGLFEACTNGECVESGCNDDRECYFATGNPLVECDDGECRIPCENDAECDAFEACQNGLCVFVGCETNEQCRVLLGIQEEDGPARAVCRDPDE